MTNIGGGYGGFGVGIGSYPGMTGGIGGGFGFPGGGMGMGYPGYGFMMGLENQVANLAFDSPFSMNPPIVQANQMYEMCRMQGLTAFEDDKYWPGPVLSSPPHGDDGAGNGGDGTNE